MSEKEPIKKAKEKESKNLYEAFLAFQRDCPPIKGTSVNTYYNTTYASLGDIISTVTPVLNRHGLFLSQVLSIESISSEGLEKPIGIITTKIVHRSGEEISSRSHYPLNLDIQKIGGYISYMRRYALQCILGLATDHDDDGVKVSNSTPATPASYAGKKKVNNPVDDELPF